PEVLQIALHLLRASLAEREVVLLGAARIGVSRQAHAADLALLDAVRVALHRGTRRAVELARVVGEVDRREAARGRGVLRLAGGHLARDAAVVPALLPVGAVTARRAVALDGLAAALHALLARGAVV